MKRLLRFLLSRSFLLAVLALLQIGVFIALALNFARLGTVFYTVEMCIRDRYCMLPAYTTLLMSSGYQNGNPASDIRTP